MQAREIRSRLSATRPADDPSRVDFDAATGDWRPGFRERLPDRLAAAAVLIPILDRRGDLRVLLTRRSAGLEHHAGQIGLPGGRMEAGDEGVAETALRETREELGIQPHEVEVAGFLATIPTLSGYAVTPVVGLLSGEPRLTLDRREVESTLEVPLDFLLEPENQRLGSGDEDRVAYPLEFHFAGERIWGVTASILIALRDTLLRPAG